MNLNEIRKHELLKQASSYSYDIKNRKIPDGYQLLGVAINEKTGFYACVLKKSDDIIIAHRGTEIPKSNDMKNDIKMLCSISPEQARDAFELYDKIYEQYPYCKITLTGHSLGGSLAQLVAAVRNASAVTFNAFGIKNLLSKNTGRIYSDNIINYCNPNDIVTTFKAKNHIGTCYKVYSNNNEENSHYLEKIQPLENRIKTTGEELDLFGRKLREAKEKLDYYDRTGMHMPIMMSSMCAGTYSVSGYKREDGTKVNGYIRTCGAKHNNPNK